MCARKPIFAWIISLFITLLSISVMPDDVFAQQTIEQAMELKTSAMEDYDFFEFESADTKLRQAAEIIESAGIKDPESASVYVAQGIVGYSSLKDSAKAIAEERALSAFFKALAIDSNAQIPEDYRSDELEEIMNRARGAIADTSRSSIAAFTDVKPSIEHTEITESPRCAPIDINASVPPHPDIFTVKLYYRTDDNTAYESIDMKPADIGTDLMNAKISGLQTQGSKIEYYIEATNRDGETVANIANAMRPLSTELTGDCVGLSDEDLVIQYGDPLFQWSVMVGTGFGMVGGPKGSDESYAYTRPDSASRLVTINRGTAILPVHLRSSIIFNLPADFQLGAYIRGQVVNIVGESNNSKEDGKVVGNIMAGITLRYLAIARQPYRLYVGLEFGWGGANASVKTLNSQYSIYLIKGPFHITPEIGFLWSFHKNVGLAIELAVPIHFPDKVSVHADFSIGPYIQF